MPIILAVLCILFSSAISHAEIRVDMPIALTEANIKDKVTAKHKLSDNAYTELAKVFEHLSKFPHEHTQLRIKTLNSTLNMDLYVSMMNAQSKEYILSGVINSDITSYVYLHLKNEHISGSFGVKGLQFEINTTKSKSLILCELKRPLPRLSDGDILPKQLSFEGEPETKDLTTDKMPITQKQSLKKTTGLFYNPLAEGLNAKLFPYLKPKAKLVYKTLYVYYSKPALEKYGMQTIESLAAQSTADTNEILKKSGAVLRINLVGTRMMAPVVKIKRFADQPSFYALASFSIYLRSQHFRKPADFVAYLTSKPSRKVTGIAYINGRHSITAAPHAIHNHTFAHELGHNFGLDHNLEKNTEEEFIKHLGRKITSFIGCLVRLVPLKNFGRGFSTPLTDSIMSYGQNRVPFYSSPDLSINNEVLGVTNKADAVRAINEKYIKQE